MRSLVQHEGFAAIYSRSLMHADRWSCNYSGTMLVVIALLLPSEEVAGGKQHKEEHGSVEPDLT